MPSKTATQPGSYLMFSSKDYTGDGMVVRFADVTTSLADTKVVVPLLSVVAIHFCDLLSAWAELKRA